MTERSSFRETYRYTTDRHRSDDRLDDAIAATAARMADDRWRLDGCERQNHLLYDMQDQIIAGREMVSAVLTFSRLYRDAS